MDKHTKTENLLYLTAWALAFLIAVLFGQVGQILPFFVIFLVHNYLIANFFFLKKNRIYGLLTALLLVLSGVYIITSSRPDDAPKGSFRVGMIGRPVPPEYMVNPGAPPDMSGTPPAIPGTPPVKPGAPGGPDGSDRRPFSPEVMKLFMCLLLLAANDGVKMYFRSKSNEERLASLEKENLRQQLEYLRYQINPHFFMNTLNNIHALVDIDPEQAKSSIVELSRLMRYLLYEGSHPTIPLEKEVEFLRHYVSLMRMRYADNVEITLDLPSDTGGVEVPPLVFASFVENAFKHGISYEHDSFIRVSMAVDGNKLIFKCANSRHEINGDADTDKGGIGLENVRKRLGLMYGDRYTLHIDKTEGVYDLLVVIPAGLNKEEDYDKVPGN